MESVLAVRSVFGVPWDGEKLLASVPHGPSRVVSY